MFILTIRTDKPESEIGLFDDDKKIAYETWQAHRQLSETIHKKIEVLLKTQQKNWHDIEGVAVFKGPGSFTGLRIGVSVANALAQSLQIPIAGGTSEDWIVDTTDQLMNGESDTVVLPEYGRDAHITTPRK